MFRRFLSRFWLSVASLALFGAAFPTAASTASTMTRVATPALGVTTAGQVLYEYEALIHQMFGASVSVCSGSGGCHQGWFYRGILGPLDEYSPFTFVFSDLGASTLHVMPAGFVVAKGFGNYPVPVKLNGRMVACGAAARKFLITYGGAEGDGNLACLAPV